MVAVPETRNGPSQGFAAVEVREDPQKFDRRNLALVEFFLIGNTVDINGEVVSLERVNELLEELGKGNRDVLPILLTPLNVLERKKPSAVVSHERQAFQEGFYGGLKIFDHRKQYELEDDLGLVISMKGFSSVDPNTSQATPEWEISIDSHMIEDNGTEHISPIEPRFMARYLRQLPVIPHFAHLFTFKIDPKGKRSTLELVIPPQVTKLAA